MMPLPVLNERQRFLLELSMNAFGRARVLVPALARSLREGGRSC